VDLAAEWPDRLRAEADGYARLALENIAREFPALVWALMTAPGQFPRRPRDRTPVFYGSFDWHSCVEMHWVLVRLLKAYPDAVPAAEIRAALEIQFTPEGLRQEAEYGPGCTPTARSRCPGRCRTRGCGPKTGGPNWPGPSRRPHTAGTPPTRTIPAAGSHQAATSCHPR
jgi:Protein of unknown function (DUF2891)